MKDGKQAKNFKNENSCETGVGNSTFRKGESVQPDVLKTATEIFDQHEDLMKQLEKLWFSIGYALILKRLGISEMKIAYLLFHRWTT